MSKLSILDPITRLGITNAKWGNCGFTSSLSAMYDLNQGVRGQVINGSSGYRMLAEVKTYLSMLKTVSRSLLDSIRNFTRSFGPPYDTFEIDDYLERINKAADAKLSRSQILSEPRFGIGLPPLAVADYIQRLWGWKVKIAEYATGDGAGDGVVGVTEGPNGSNALPKPYHGLCHYLYRSNGAVYSWGIKFNTVAEAAQSQQTTYRVCYVVRVTTT
jgi:hypothetical protein